MDTSGSFYHFRVKTSAPPPAPEVNQLESRLESIEGQAKSGGGRNEERSALSEGLESTSEDVYAHEPT